MLVLSNAISIMMTSLMNAENVHIKQRTLFHPSLPAGSFHLAVVESWMEYSPFDWTIVQQTCSRAMTQGATVAKRIYSIDREGFRYAT
ncbi:unnamed protein product [Cyclocybe aegerita]|uniref:Uncharacterized protein n=1 Tax=Cyclocybe aegerita TaxID=1973307 RepID=A0A8S0W0B3_CYCAE|nr:unnamed protein product [Cyclocybe aegerita]